MSWGLVAAAGASVVGGAIASKGAKDAGKESAAASDRATEENRRQYNLGMLANILMNTPQINAENAARAKYAGLLGISTPSVNYSDFSQYISPEAAQGKTGQQQIGGDAIKRIGSVAAKARLF